MQRLNPAGQELYAIACPSYDLRGNLLGLCSPAGDVHYAYDLLGRKVSIRSSYWWSHLEHFDLAGNLLKMSQQDPTGIFSGQFAYDRLDHLTKEVLHEAHTYAYDSLGNCIQKDTQPLTINALNQVTHDTKGAYAYDQNGNLQTEPHAVYTYDALNRLISCEKEGQKTTFLYDTFDRCLQIKDNSYTKQLLYLHEQEIGCLLNGQMEELRVMHPDEQHDLTFAIELKGQPFFPIQDFRGNIAALQTPEGKLAQWSRYTAFGNQQILGDVQNLLNPWRFANRREVTGLSLFAHRFYNPRLMRWQTTDPLRFEDGLNLYAYVHNNPFAYQDPDGQFAIAVPFPVVIPIFKFAFGAGAGAAVGATAVTFLPAFGVTLVGAVALYSCYQLAVYANNQINDVETAEPPKTYLRA